MSHLYAITFFENGKESFSTEMRDRDDPLLQAQSFVEDRQAEGTAAAALVIKYMQNGLDLSYVATEVFFNRNGKKDPQTVQTVRRAREKAEKFAAQQTRAAQTNQKKRRPPPTVFMTQKGGGIKKKTTQGTSHTLHGDEALRALEDIFFTGPVIEFGSGKNKRLVPLEDAQRMAAQLESASYTGARRKPPRRRPEPKTVSGVLDRVRARKPIRPCRPKFTTGVIEVSDYARAIASPAEVRRALVRFEACDWGDVGARIVARNNAATRKRHGELRGQYQSARGVFLILSKLSKTGNASTFVALPEEVD